MEKKWWHNSTVYQIYPRSFKDSNNDGIGDIKGIISKLDYLQNLGIDILWISPVFKSPMDDNGYDISDYKDIAEEFGTMQDMECLISEAKDRGIKILIDLVVNHTSDEHPWFINSRESKDSPYRDFYVWRNQKSDISSIFGGSAWEFDEKTNEYYLHFFSRRQPDLNWHNPKVRREIYDMMNFWINKGIAGFRMDVIDLIGKEIEDGVVVSMDKTHDYLREMHEETFGKHDMFTVGETGGVTFDKAKLFINPSRKELHTVFHFEHVSLDQQKHKSKWDLKDLDLIEFKDVMSKWQTELGVKELNSLYFCNHDQPRVISRWGDDSNEEYRVLSGKMLATILHFMRGVPYVYQGEEIGMTNSNLDSIEKCRDIEIINMYNERVNQGIPVEEIMKSIQVKGRDNARTPMQWDDTLHGGFTEGNPWIDINENYIQINVKKSLEDNNSLFYYYKDLINFRKNNDIVVYGKYKLIYKDDKSIFAYIREYEGQKILVVCNFYKDCVPFNFKCIVKKKIISNYSNVYEEFENITLRAYESFAYFID